MNFKAFAGFLLGIGIGLAILFGVYSYSNQNYSLQGSVFEPSLKAFDFRLMDQDGEVFDLEDHRDKVVLLFFGYTNCPDVCPTTLAEFKIIRNKLEELAIQAEFVFITVDPERDSPEKMRDYVSRFHSDFIGLSGSVEELEPIWEAYFVSSLRAEVVEANEDADHGDDEDYLLDHTSRVIVIDKLGNFRMTFPFGMDSESMTQDIVHLINE